MPAEAAATPAGCRSGYSPPVAVVVYLGVTPLIRRLPIKLRGLVFLLGFSLPTAAAHAQIGIYGKLDTLRFNDNANKNTTWLYGPGVGVYDDFLHFGPLRAGVDLRGDFLYGSDQKRFRSILGGVRVAVKPPILPFKPYIQGSIGAGGIKNTSNLTANRYSTKFEYQVTGGVDTTILPRIDWRAIEVGYGRMPGVGSAAGTPNSSMLTISTGIVFRLPWLPLL